MYNREDILQQCLDVIEQHNVTTFDELSLYVAPALRTLYDWELHELQDIKAGIEKNKVAAKAKLKANWLKAEAAPVLQLAAFKLMANDDEFTRLATQKQDIKADATGVVLNVNMPDAIKAD